MRYIYEREYACFRLSGRPLNGTDIKDEAILSGRMRPLITTVWVIFRNIMISPLHGYLRTKTLKKEAKASIND
jgi:hypothetical protein